MNERGTLDDEARSCFSPFDGACGFSIVAWDIEGLRKQTNDISAVSNVYLQDEAYIIQSLVMTRLLHKIYKIARKTQVVIVRSC